MIFNNGFNFIYSGDCQRIFLLLGCLCLFLNGSIMSPHSTFISFVLADSDNKDNKHREVSSDSNEKEKSSEKNSDNEDRGSSEKSDEQDDPRKQDESSKKEEPPTDQE